MFLILLREASLTSHGRLVGVVLGCLVTYPLLTALSRDLDATWVGAVGRGQPHVAGTRWHAADLAVHADAVVLAAWLECLAAAVDDPSQITRLALLGCRQNERVRE